MKCWVKTVDFLSIVYCTQKHNNVLKNCWFFCFFFHTFISFIWICIETKIHPKKKWSRRWKRRKKHVAYIHPWKMLDCFIYRKLFKLIRIWHKKNILFFFVVVHHIVLLNFFAYFFSCAIQFKDVDKSDSKKCVERNICLENLVYFIDWNLNMPRFLGLNIDVLYAELTYAQNDPTNTNQT